MSDRQRVNAVRGCRCQYVSIDTLVAIIAFIAVLVIVITSWQHIMSKVDQQESDADLEMLADHAALLLFSTPGQPSSWHNETSWTNLGLKSGQAIDHRKMAALSGLSGADLRRGIGVLGAGYNVSINYTVFNASSSGYDQAYHAGVAPVNATVVKVREYLGLDENMTYVRAIVKVWT